MGAGARPAIRATLRCGGRAPPPADVARRRHRQQVVTASAGMARVRMNSCSACGDALAARHGGLERGGWRCHGGASRSAPARPAPPAVIQVRRQARSSASSPVRAGNCRVRHRVAWKPTPMLVQHGRVGEVALHARDRQLLEKCLSTALARPKLQRHSAEVDQVDLVRHGRGADLAFLELRLK